MMRVRHHMLDRAVFSRGIHRLKDQQDGMAIVDLEKHLHVNGRVEQLLLRAQLRNVLFREFLILLLRFVHGIDLRRPLFEIDLVSFAHAKVLGINFHRLGLPADLPLISHWVNWRSSVPSRAVAWLRHLA